MQARELNYNKVDVPVQIEQTSHIKLSHNEVRSDGIAISLNTSKVIMRNLVVNL